MRLLLAVCRLVRLRAEVHRAVRERAFLSDRPASPDAVQATDIPSVALVGTGDRLLAEIDQDGYEFAFHPVDGAFFRPRDIRLPRIRYQINVQLRSGTVCLGKRFTRQPLSSGLREWLLSFCGLGFYTEAAALVRLKDCEGAPRLVDIDIRTRTIYREFIRGQSVRQVLARQGLVAEDVHRRFGRRPARTSSPLVPAAASLMPARELVAGINREGVVPCDVKLGNILLGERSRALYWVDFEDVRFRSDWDWEERVATQNLVLEYCYRSALGARTAADRDDGFHEMPLTAAH